MYPDERSKNELKERCKGSFSIVASIIDNELTYVTPFTTFNRKALINELSLENTIDAVIWQLSDIHFGRLNLVENDPRELASILEKACAENQQIAPDLILITGDITSVADDSEFDRFSSFCEYLSKSIWGKYRPSRFLVVPGNHDTLWLEGFGADRLDRFQQRTNAITNIITTPFGTEEAIEKIDFQLFRHKTNDHTPPFASVYYPSINLELFLFVSSYFSGCVPDEVQKALEKFGSGNIESTLTNLLRVDKGCINRQYLAQLSQSLLKSTRNEGVTRIGAIHHNLCPYGYHVCLNEFADEFLKTLMRWRIQLILHGHVHLMPGKALDIATQKTNQAYPIACTSLTSHCLVESNGFNIHLLTEVANGERTFITRFWPISGNTFFDYNHLESRYIIKLRQNEVEVQTPQ